MRVGILGPLVVDGANGSLSPRDRVVLAVLVLQGGQVVSTERLADALWGDDPPASAAKVVQGCVVRLRKVLGPAAIETHPTGYRLVLGADDVDLHRFERLVGRAREQLALQAPDRALQTAGEALALWRGRPFDDVEGWDDARIEAARIEELRHEAEELRIDAALRAGRHREVLAAARGMVDAAPTRERRWELLALAQYRSGSQADSLRTLQEARRRLALDLGLDPGPGLVELEQAILRHDEDLQGPSIPGVVADSCPWPGLLAYSTDDVEGFAGREREIDACLARLETEGVLVVVGPSGGGKSSLIRAGVAGRLTQNGTRVTVITPGTAPLDALTRRGSIGDSVLVVDQCEEVVTVCDDPQQRDGFFDALVEHAEWSGGAGLVVALRADRLGDLSAHPGFARLVERGLYLLTPMDEGALREAIESPARAAGLLLEPGLVDLVVRDVLDEPGALPLMSHALTQTWARREGRTLTVASYTETGGIRGAVAQSAEAVFSEIDDAARSKLRTLLLRLVTPVEDGAPARVRLPRRTIADDPDHLRLVERLVASRLLTTDDEWVELAHEALARAWPRFRDWLDEDIEGLRILRHLSATAEGWDSLGRPDSELYRGERLAGALAWQERAEPDLTATEAAFLDASVEHQRAQLRAAEVQVEAERRTVRRLRRLIAGVAVLAVAALVATAVAVRQRDAADEQATVAQARRLAAQALETKRYDHSLLLALEAVRRWDSAETEGALLTAIGRSPRVEAVLPTGGAVASELAVSSDGAHLAVADDAGAVRVYDLTTRKEIGHLAHPSGGAYFAPSFSPDASQLAVASLTGDCFFHACGGKSVTIEVFAADDLDATPTGYSGMLPPTTHVAWSDDGRYLVGSGPFFHFGHTDSIGVWRVDEPAAPIHLLKPRYIGSDVRPIPTPFSPSWVAFSPDGDTLYASGSGPVTALDLTSGKADAIYDGLGALALSPDGSLLALRAASNEVRLVDTATGATVAKLSGHDAMITGAAFTADGSRLATASNDESVSVWDVEAGTRLLDLRGHAGAILDVTFDDSGARLFSSATDRSVIEWDLDDPSTLAPSLAGARISDTGAKSVQVSPDGETLALVYEEEGVTLLGSSTGDVRTFENEDERSFGGAAFSPDSRTFVTVDYTSRTRLWRVSDGELVAEDFPRDPVGSYGAVAFSPDGATVLRADADGAVVELDSETLKPTGRELDLDIEAEPETLTAGAGGRVAATYSPRGAGGETRIVFADMDALRVEREVRVGSIRLLGAFNEDGTRFGYGGADGRVGVVDVASGAVSGRADPVHIGLVSSVAFSPDGTTLTSIGFDGVLVLSDAADARSQAQLVPGPVGSTAGLRFAPDGHTLLLGYWDGTVLSFDADPATWVAHACAVAGRDLTDDEWRDAFGDEERRPTCS